MADEVTVPARLSDLAGLAHVLVATHGRLAKVEAAAALLRRLAPEEAEWAVAFLTGRPFPASDPRVLEVRFASLRSLGDLPAEPPAASLSLMDVAEAFGAIAAAGGPGSRARKQAALRALLGAATREERDFLFRLLHGEMRLGLQEGLIPDVIAAAHGLDPGLVRRALLFRSDPARVAGLAAREGATGLARTGAEPFVPLAPMLADPAGGVAEALAAHGGRTAVEFKYDGVRVQVHRAGGQVRIWSRRLTEVTASLPDVVAVAAESLAAESCILDGEVVATGPDGRPLPFQDLMRRLRRVHGVAAAAAEVPLRLHLFDCLFRDGTSLVDATEEARWAALTEVVRGPHLARRFVVEDVETGEARLAEALGAGHEGLIAKALDGPYLPGSRGRRWLKVKGAESVECVIVAADRGSGRRRGWLSNYHLAVREGTGSFAPVGKTFKGLTDREFSEMTARLAALAVADDGYTVTVRPEVVVEVAYGEIQRSPQYASGLALRFARITRVRDDRGPGDATTLGELRRLFERQLAAKARGGPPD